MYSMHYFASLRYKHKSSIRAFLKRGNLFYGERGLESTRRFSLHAQRGGRGRMFAPLLANTPTSPRSSTLNAFAPAFTLDSHRVADEYRAVSQMQDPPPAGARPEQEEANDASR